jgi:hypothetical protein
MSLSTRLIILGSTDERAPKGIAPIAIGICLGPDAHSPDHHPGNQYLGKPGTQHRSGADRRWLGVT